MQLEVTTTKNMSLIEDEPLFMVICDECDFRLPRASSFEIASSEAIAHCRATSHVPNLLEVPTEHYGGNQTTETR